MDSLIISKFGGSSLANADQIEKVRKIVADAPARRVVVVSAPGKDNTDKEKMTDHLFNIATEGSHFKLQKKNISPEESYKAVVGKFSMIIKDLGIDGGDILSDLENDLHKSIVDKKKKDFYASRGEHYNAKIFARYCKKKGMNAQVELPEDIGFIVSEDFGNARVLPETYNNIRKIKGKDSIAIIPGYYGITQSNDIAVLSRGGSDLTGGEVAYALEADLYENWTDTDGIYQVDPRRISDAAVIPRLTYKEIRLLSSKGFNVFHFDAMVSCKKKKIPINIRNTNNPSAKGTLIVSERVPEETVVGIAQLDDIAFIYIEKDMIGENIGCTNKIFQILKDYGIHTYHYPTDKDDIAIIVSQEKLRGNEDSLNQDIYREIKPDNIEINYNLSMLSPVGIGMKDHPGVIAKASTALKDNNINIEIIDQGPAQISFHFGIQSFHSDNALKALYNALLKKK